MTAFQTFLVRCYRVALHAFPAPHRAVYGAETVDAFERALTTDRETDGVWGSMRFALAACIDALQAGLGERRRQRHRQRRGTTVRELFGSWGGDLLHAARSLSKARGFTLVSVMSLGIGIGVVILMALVVRTFTGRPPGIVAENLVELLVIPQGELRARVNDWAIDTWSYPDFTEVRDARTGMNITGWTPAQAILRPTGGAAARVDAMYVSPNYFETVGVRLARGPGFSPDADATEVVLSHRAWQRRLDAREDVIGSTLSVNGVPHIIVGVTAEGFRGHFAQHRPGFELWLPLERHPRFAGSSSLRMNRTVDWVHILGRLAPGTRIADAGGAVASIMNAAAERHPANRFKSGSVEPYVSTGARRHGDMRAEALSTLVAAVMVLLVVCLNLSGMMMVRAATRERELAVRLAVGASRRRLIQYLLSEAFLLAVLGGAIGAAVVFGIPAALTWWAGEPLEIAFRPDAQMALVAAGLCLGASALFGLLPAVRFSRPLIMRALKDDAGGGRRVGRVHRWTAAIQAGIAVPFLVIGGVQLEQFRATAGADLGFDPAGLFALPLDVADAKRAAAGSEWILRTIESELERAAGVAAVSFANGLPLDGQTRRARVARDGDAVEVIRAHTTRVSPDYLETMRIPLRRGRGITAGDQPGSELVVVISQALASRLFPAADAVGQRVRFALESADVPVDPRWPHVSVPSTEQTFTIVGVTADVVDGYLGPPEPQLFVPLGQHPAARVYVIARSSAPAQAMTAAYQKAIEDQFPDPDVLTAGMITIDRLVRGSRYELVYFSILAAIGGSAALMLAALGVFGVIGFMVATRTREIGIRIALGASRSLVLRGVLLDAAKLAGWGIAVGLALAVLWASEISWSPFAGVEPFLYATAVAIALGVALIAGLPAARRAAAVEPIVAMRAE